MDILLTSDEAIQAIEHHRQDTETPSECANRLLASLLHLAHAPADTSEILTIFHDDDEPARVSVYVGHVPYPLYRGPLSLALVEAVVRHLVPEIQLVIAPHDAQGEGEEAAA